MALSCDLASLTAASRCFNCLSATEKEALKVYFMAQTLKAAGGLDLTDLNVRNQASACLGCESDFMLDSMETAIWQNLAINMGANIPTLISDLRKLIRCTPCGEQKGVRAAFISLLCRLVGLQPRSREAGLWAEMVVNNGGPQPSANTIQAADAFLKSIASLRSRIYHLNFIAPDSLIAMRTPLISTVGLKFWLPVQLGAGFAENLSASGWNGSTNETDAIVYNTGVSPAAISAFGTGNGGMSLYDPRNGTSNKSLVGSRHGNTNLFMLLPGDFPGLFVEAWCYGVTTALQPANPGGVDVLPGFYSFSRTATNAFNLYFANSTNAFQSLASTAVANAVTPPAELVSVGGMNNSGVYTACDQWISFMAIHDGFTSTESQLLFNAVQALRVAIGGGFA